MFFTSKEEKIIIQFLSNSPFFGGVSTRSLRSLVKKFLPTPIKSGEYVMKQGEVGNSLYLVMHGRLRIFETQELGQNELGEIGPGEFIGEVALLTGSTRIVSAFAIRDSVLLKLNREDFFTFTKNHYNQMIEIVKHTIMRLKNKNYINKRLHTFCLMPAGESNHLRAFSNTFINILGGKTLYLTQHNIKKKLKTAGIDISESGGYEKMTQWLNDQEKIYRYIIYESGPELNSWSKLCIRQADKALLIANTNAPCDLNPLETYLYENSHCTKTLVILQDSGITLPLNTRRWLKQRSLQSHHHVRLDNAETVIRLRRYLCNESISLVLGGGGARGLGHIGAYKAFVERNIPIDCVGGTSSGAVMGALIAMNYSVEEIIENIKKKVIDNKKLFQYTLPIYSVISGKPIARTLSSLLGKDTRTEDLWRRFFCVATCLSSLEERVLTEGLLWKNIRASLSIPGIFPPISTPEAELLVDGAVMNNLPVDLMETFSNNGYVISVNVSGKPKITSTALPNGWISPWHALNQRFSVKKLPTIPEIMLEAGMICSGQHQVLMRKRSDLNIDCFTENFSLLDFKAFDALIKLGYETTMNALDGCTETLPTSSDAS
jgi:predicted acylesterase/phospholipase RssA